MEWVEGKITFATKAMKEAQDSANSEEKSSAGDKYETGRAMSQNARDMYARQLKECIKQKQFLLNIDSAKKSDKVLSGSLVTTESGSYFISISAGNVEVEGKPYFAVSPDTPIAQLILNKKVDDCFVFNGRESRIKTIL